MIGSNRVGDVLDQHGLAGAGGGNNQAALAFTDRRHQFDHPHRHIVRHGLKFELFLGVQRRQVVKQYLVAGDFGGFEVDRFNFEKGKIALPLLGRPDLAGNRITGAQVETADLAG